MRKSVYSKALRPNIKAVGVLLCGMIAVGGAPLLSAANWTGQADNDYFDDAANWESEAPGTWDTADFIETASVDFRTSAEVSSLTIGQGVSLLLNGRSFKTNSTWISSGAVLMLQGGIASLGGINANGSLVATGAGTFVKAQDISSSSSSESHSFLFSNGAVLQAGAVAMSGAFNLQFQSGATGMVDRLTLGSTQSLSVSGPGSRFTTEYISGSGSVSVTDSGVVTLNSNSSYMDTLSISGDGSALTGKSITAKTYSVGAGAQLNLDALHFQGNDGTLAASGPGTTLIVRNVLGQETYLRGSVSLQGGASLTTTASLSYLDTLKANGAGTTFSSSGNLDLSGNLMLEDGATLEVKRLLFSNNQVDRTLTISGLGSNLTADSISGVGLTSVTGGGTMRLLSGDNSASGVGVLLVSGNGSAFLAEELSVGSIEISTGGTLKLKRLNFQDSSGNLSASGVGTMVTIQEFSEQWYTQRGDITVSDGASLITGTSSNGTSYFSNVAIVGAGSAFTAKNNLDLSGNLSIQTGGSLSANQVTLSTGGFLALSGAASRLIAETVTAKAISVTGGAVLNVNQLGLQEGGSLTASGEGTSITAQSWSGVGNGFDLTLSAGASVSTESVFLYLKGASITGVGSGFRTQGSLDINNNLILTDGGSLSAQRVTLNGATRVKDAALNARFIENNGHLDIRDSTIGSQPNYGSQAQITNHQSGVLTGSFSTDHELQNLGSMIVDNGDIMAFRKGSNSNGANITVSGGSLQFLNDFENNGNIALVGEFRANGGVRNYNSFEVIGNTNIWGGDFQNFTSASVAVFAQSTANFMDDVVNDGVIAVGPDSTVVFHGSYSGSGTITGEHGTTMMLGDLRPGHSPGKQSFEGDLVFGDLASYQVEIAGLLQGAEYDLIEVGGHLTLGGTLSVSVLNDFTLQIGDSFEVLRFGSIEGAFNQFEGFDLGNDLSLETTWGEHNLVLTVIPEPTSTVYLVSVGIASWALFARRRMLALRRDSEVATVVKES